MKQNVGKSAGYALGHQDIWFPRTICVRNHTDNDEAHFLVEAVGVAFEIGDIGDVLDHIRVQVDARQGGHVIFIIGT